MNKVYKPQSLYNDERKIGVAMMKNDLYAVVTGDIIGSSRFKEKTYRELMLALNLSFETIKETWPNISYGPFRTYRGDSFQGILSRPEKALHVAIVIRACLRSFFQIKRRRNAVDARIAIGIGTISSLPHGPVAEGDGEAFRRSGPILDKIEQEKRSKTHTQLFIKTPWNEVDTELEVECILLDALINRWSAEQAEAILDQMRGLTQRAAARKHGITQSAVSQRLLDAGGHAIRKLCRRYQSLIIGAKNNGNFDNTNERRNL